MTDTQRSKDVYPVQRRIAQLARERPQECFTALNHYLNVDWLKAAYERVKPSSAPGIDGQRWSQYGQDLETNLSRLLDRAKSGSYVAPPVKRAHIPKGEGPETRAIGMPTIEDKVLQRAVVMLLEPIYEQDFKYYFGYFGLTGNYRALQRYRRGGIGIWRKWLARRGDRKGMSWTRMYRLLEFWYLPEARVVHSVYAVKP